ncbi:hypothetical protein [Pseudomonas sp. Xaverov 259]|uniref:hypothetical protein n=1 Tax=Pseudomonas sp. Xaverov 259 TaxID=2666086 RepID=UPI00214B81A6|nr:hypothetical protein [Pseudomonas sp. Xaverov 259]
MIDVLQRAIEELPDIAIDLAYLTGAAINELVNGLGPCIQDGDNGDQADRDKSDRDEREHELVFYFHRDDHRARRRFAISVCFGPMVIKL